MSLRLQVLLILALAGLLGDGLFIAWWQPWYFEQLSQREQQAQQRHLITLGDAVTPFLLQNQVGAVYEVLDAALERQTAWRSVKLQDADAAPIYPLQDAPDPALADDRHLLHLSHALTLRNRSLGRLELVVDMQEHQKALRSQTALIVGLVSLSFLLAAALIAVMMEAVIGRRTRQLMIAAQAMARGDFQATLPSRTCDEIGRLADAFDRMRSAIAAEKRALEQARQEAEASSAAKTTFLATMSHEIRTPLNGILGMAQMLHSPTLAAADRLKYAQVIVSSGHTLMTLLNDILDLSKVEAGKIELVQEAFEPERLLSDTSALFSQMARERGLGLSERWHGPRGARFTGDHIRLRQMLSNLVSNALKFTRQGEVCIEASVVQQDAQAAVLEFSVSDTGIGIETQVLGQLFQPFRQLDGSNTRPYGGTGLGLSIVRSLAELMGGQVGVDSRPGRGSRFWFSVRLGLPQAAAAGAAPEATPAQIAASAPSRLAGRRILLVEDNPVNRMVVEVMLHEHGLRTEAAANGEEALRMLARPDHPYELVLMDCQMPVMDGFTATRALRRLEAQEQRCRLPVVALTAGAYEGDRQHCLAVGMDDYLRKPVEMKALLSTLEQWLPRPATEPRRGG